MNCSKCGNIVNETNYCSNCGNAISKLAKEYENVKVNTIKLETLNELCSKNIDEKTKQIIKQMISKI